ALSAEVLRRIERRLDRRYDLFGDLVLYRENIDKVAIEALGPNVIAAVSLGELRADAQAAARFAHAAFEEVAHARPAAVLLHIDGRAFVGRAAGARDDEEPAHLRERGDDLLDHAVGEVFLVRVARHVLERQYGD